jgi:DHA1 family multidrug resistance protein-like MFS transporter
MGALSVVLEVFLFEECYRPIILTRKARELRLRTGNWGIYAPHELDLRELVQDNLNRPINMLVREPILFLISPLACTVFYIYY